MVDTTLGVTTTVIGDVTMRDALVFTFADTGTLAIIEGSTATVLATTTTTITIITTTDVDS